MPVVDVVVVVVVVVYQYIIIPEYPALGKSIYKKKNKEDRYIWIEDWL